MIAAVRLMPLLYMFCFIGFASAQSPSAPLRVGIDLTYYPYDYQEQGMARGFDPEMMRLLSTKLARDLEFKDTRIENIILGLQATHYDVVASALYVNAARAKEVNFLPYLETGGVLLVRSDASFFPTNLDQLCGRSVASMKGAAWLDGLQLRSEQQCIAQGKAPILIKEYPSAPQATQALLAGAVEVQYEDAAVASQVISALHPKVVKSSEQLLDPVLIGLAFNKNNRLLQQQLNTALQQVILSGEYQTLLDQYGLNYPSSELLQQNSELLHAAPAASSGFNWYYLGHLLIEKAFWQAALLVVVLSTLAWGIGNIFGFLFALGRLSKRRGISRTIAAYIWFFRSVPLLVLLIFIYNLPQFWSASQSWLSLPFVSGLIALVLSESAYLAEIHRGALQSISPQQYAAAKGLGLSIFTIQWYIIIPQALRRALPALTNQYITIIKLTSLISVISLNEILLVGQRFYTRNFLVIETLIVVAFYYILIITVVSHLLGRVEKYLKVSHTD